MGPTKYTLNAADNINPAHFAASTAIKCLISLMSGGELLEMRLLDKKWNRSFFICRTCINI